MPRIPAHRSRRKPPFFHPVPLRSRRDGWSVWRQCEFLAQLYLTGSVAVAARHVGMSRASAYRLREHEGAEGFAHAWDAVFLPPGEGRIPARKIDWRKVTLGTLMTRFESGLVQPVIHNCRMTAIRQKPDNSSMLRLLRRVDAVEHALWKREGWI